MPVVKSDKNLGSIIDRAVYIDQVLKEELKFGDFVLIDTENSTYEVYVLQDDSYLVSGGWFDRNELSPAKVSINGCTWGGNIIKINTIAACGLRIEFSNGLVTSRVQRVMVFNMNGKS
jgi:hypothetical protein